jgi:uncharacterized coiled-coil protein SlyX
MAQVFEQPHDSGDEQPSEAGAGGVMDWQKWLGEIESLAAFQAQGVGDDDQRKAADRAARNRPADPLQVPGGIKELDDTRYMTAGEVKQHMCLLGKQVTDRISLQNKELQKEVARQDASIARQGEVIAELIIKLAKLDAKLARVQGVARSAAERLQELQDMPDYEEAQPGRLARLWNWLRRRGSRRWRIVG